MPAGRPALEYDPEVAEEICERIATSEDGLEQVIDELKLTFGDRVPSVRVVYRWLESSEEFRQKSARARTLQAQLLHDRAQVYARQPLIGVVRTEIRKGDSTEIQEKTCDNVERSKLLVQTTLRRAGQLDPKKYADKTPGDSPDNPLHLKVEDVRGELISKLSGGSDTGAAGE